MKYVLGKVWREILRPIRRQYIKSIPQRIDTSISDNQAYPQICLDASNDYRLFNTFRRNPIYNTILEHVSRSHGKEYLDLISKDQDILEALDTFKANDKYGNPIMYEYSGAGMISPSTLRYIKVLADLKKHFRTLDNFSICEIGIGYGGQCRIINAYYKPSLYCLVDLRQVLTLASRFLDKYIIPAVLNYTTMNELGRHNYDLVLSNYAFTELPRAIQEVYLEKVLLRSKRGYITYNAITPVAFNSYTRNELLEILPDPRVYEEEPLTDPSNCIIAWGENV